MARGTLSGKVALITGAGSTIGMGRVMALALGAAGARVAMMDVDAASLEASAGDVREIAGDDAVLPIVGDISSWDDAQRAVSETIEGLGGLHVLINHAGINARYAGLPETEHPPFWELPPAVWTRVIDVNVNGPFLMARAAVGHMVAQGWGRVIGVTTNLDTMIRDIPYGPSKSAHEALVASMAPALEGTGVTANALLPGGGTNTNFNQRWDRDRSALVQPEVMGPPAVWLASEAADGVNGMRVIAMHWDERRSGKENLERAAAPAAWPQLGRRPPGT